MVSPFEWVPRVLDVPEEIMSAPHYALRAAAFTIEPLQSSVYNQPMPVFEEKQEELEHYETMMGVPRGRLAVTMDTITDAMALVGQHGVYCQSQRWPGKPVMDIQIIMKSLTDAKELIQSVMEELKKKA
jgi:hypothetical protein